MSEPIIQSFLQDFRYGVRILRKSPGFSAIAILSLALGIMAATAMYSVIYGVVLNGLKAGSQDYYYYYGADYSNYYAAPDDDDSTEVLED